MSAPTTQAISLVHPPPGTRVSRLAVVAALLFSLARESIVVAVGLPSPGWDLALGMASSLLALVILGRVGLTGLRRPWRRPVRLVAVGPGLLRVPAAPAFGWLVAGLVLLLPVFDVPLAGAVDLLRDPEGPPGPLGYLLAAAPLLLAALWLLPVVLLVVAVFGDRPRVDLTPAGLEIREQFGRRRIPWEALAPGTPVRQRSGASLLLRVVRPELIEGRGLVWSPVAAPRLWLGWLPVHPWFLADVLRFYVDHTEERAAIGTTAGNDRLCRALSVG
ncbi:PH domain-containing protein [Micromonospora sp. NPDC047738]|uniref:PH domain-containing protein n=1 Tax=unclassified Micromonospora TaxID=2617518 RepID=UPI0033DA28BA